MSLFPAYSDGDSVPWKCSDQDIKKDDAVGAGLLHFKGYHVWRGDGKGYDAITSLVISGNHIGSCMRVQVNSVRGPASEYGSRMIMWLCV